ncbi:uncharacterized protein RJT20DRAFT_41213 [Scheffersomyces xylosifermentans]|uniref:uncharacterized protein n=1 Tax=Scheffersomyces xylosifermentans TaxID=1304137 RepID=UPI00315DE4B5
MTTSMDPDHKPPPKRRSRGGCFSCKHLRIKCDESKPKCEYCIHTNRICVYPQSKAKRKGKKSYPSPGSSSESSVEYIEREVEDINVRESMLRDRRAKSGTLFTFNQLAALNRTTSQLSISTFELRLVKFFNEYCVYLFSFGVNEGIHNVWKNYVPSLFLQSRLVRDSIYAFSAINMFPLYDLDLVKHQDDLHGRMQVEKIKDSTRISYNPNISNGDEDSIYVRTAKYFISSVNKTNTIIGSNIIGPMAPASVSDITAKELVISGILTFSFLAIHPHKLVPLVDFSPERSDYLSICKGIRATLQMCGPTLLKTDFRGLFSYSEGEIFAAPLKESTYPLIMKLKKELEDIYQSNEFDSGMTAEYETFLAVIDIFNRAMHTSTKFNYPVPVYRCILLFPVHFHAMVYEKNFFALRLVYIFAGLATVMRFQLFDDSNMWLDYMNWYKEYNLENFGNTWKYKLDKDFYTVAVTNFFSFRNVDFSYLSSFDPELLS